MKLNLAISELVRLKEDHEYTSRLHNSTGNKEQAAIYLEVAAQCHDALRILRFAQAVLCAGCKDN